MWKWIRDIAALGHPLHPVNRKLRSEGLLQSWGTEVLLRTVRSVCSGAVSMVSSCPFRLFHCSPIPILTTQAVSRTEDSTGFTCLAQTLDPGCS